MTTYKSVNEFQANRYVKNRKLCKYMIYIKLRIRWWYCPQLIIAEQHLNRLILRS